MTFGATLGKHLMIPGSANIAHYYNNKTYMEVAANNINIKIQFFLTAQNLKLFG